MINILRSDLYRFGKSKLLIGMTVFTSITALLLMLLIRQDIHFGISVIGDLTAFKSSEDVVHIGVNYQKGLGILIAGLISIFIGQEYQWKTWQHKWITNKNRYFIYLSKALLSSAVSVMIFLVFEAVVLFSSEHMKELLTRDYLTMIVCGTFIYMALGSVFCLFSMLIRNNTISMITCLAYVILGETFVSIINNVSSFSEISTKITEWFLQHSIYGMSLTISIDSLSPNIIIPFLINSLVIMIGYTAIGLFLFRRYEL